jgi:AcrR family transcriptional regulator
MAQRRAQKESARRPRDAAATRARLLDAAEREFAAKGYAGARLLAIASAARVKPSLLHFHYRGKEGLYAAVLERAFAALESRVEALLVSAAASFGATEDLDLRALGESLVGVTQLFYAEHGRVVALLRNEAVRGSRLAKRITDKHVRPVFEAVIDRIQRLKEAGIVASDVDARHLFASVVSMTAYPIVEPLFADAVWPDRGRDETLARERREEIVATALARMRARRGVDDAR